MLEVADASEHASETDSFASQQVFAEEAQDSCCDGVLCNVGSTQHTVGTTELTLSIQALRVEERSLRARLASYA